MAAAASPGLARSAIAARALTQAFEAAHEPAVESTQRATIDPAASLAPQAAPAALAMTRGSISRISASVTVAPWPRLERSAHNSSSKNGRSASTVSDAT